PPWREEFPAETIRLDDLIIGSRGFGPAGSPEHKAATWDFYKARGGEWEYERWSAVYDANQMRASDAHDAANAFMKPWDGAAERSRLTA
ncbi:MAG: hypothetical protein ACOZJZ_03385, partial [Pseudomonadota bacterium]